MRISVAMTRWLTSMCALGAVACSAAGAGKPAAQAVALPSASASALAAARPSASPSAAATEPPRCLAGPAPARVEPRAGAPALRVRLRIDNEAIYGRDDAVCGGSIRSYAVDRAGGFWGAGDCGVRFFVAAQRFVDHREGYRRIRAEVSELSYLHGLDCIGRFEFGGIVAREPDEIHLGSVLSCGGTDPNTAFPQGRERFTGARWLPVQWRPSPEWLLTGADGGLWGFTWLNPTPVSEDATKKLPNQLFRWDRGRWVVTDVEHASYGEDEYPEPRHVAVAPDGTVWLAGEMGVGATGTPRSFLWRAPAGQFAEEPIDERFHFDLSIAPDGSVWLAGQCHLWRYRDARWQAIASGPIVSVWARSESEVWFVRSAWKGANSVWRYDGREATMVPYEGEDAPGSITGSGEHVWATDGAVVWKLASEPLAVERVAIQPPPAREQLPTKIIR